MAQTSTSRQIKVTVVAASGLIKREVFNLPDPFAVVTIDGNSNTSQTTKVVKRSLSPSWNEEFSFTVDDHSVINVQIYDNSKFNKNHDTGFLGVVDVRVAELDLSNHDIHTFELKKSNYNQVVNGRLALQIILDTTRPEDQESTSSALLPDIRPKKPLSRFLTTQYLRAQHILYLADEVTTHHMQIYHLARQALTLVVLLNDSVDIENEPSEIQLDEAIDLSDDLIELEKDLQKWGEYLRGFNSDIHSEVEEWYGRLFNTRSYFHNTDPSHAIFERLQAYDSRAVRNGSDGAMRIQVNEPQDQTAEKERNDNSSSLSIPALSPLLLLGKLTTTARGKLNERAQMYWGDKHAEILMRDFKLTVAIPQDERWVCIIKINGSEVARSVEHRKKTAANEEASLRALKWMDENGFK